jgi:hypothetical protein
MTENQRKAQQEEKYLQMIRTSEDYYDTIDCEKETRKDLVEREKLMKQESNYKEIQSNHSLSKPMHELYKGINKRMDEPCEVTGMGGHQMKDSDRFNK